MQELFSKGDVSGETLTTLRLKFSALKSGATSTETVYATYGPKEAPVTVPQLAQEVIRTLEPVRPTRPVEAPRKGLFQRFISSLPRVGRASKIG